MEQEQESGSSVTEVEQTIHYQRTSSNIVIGTVTYKLYACDCGSLVWDRFRHHSANHEGKNMQVMNELVQRGSIVGDRRKLREVGKKIKVVGAGKLE